MVRTFLDFVKDNKEKDIYIYGVCGLGEKILECLIINEIKMKGFIVSKTFAKEREDVYFIDEIDTKKAAIIIAVRSANYNVVVPQIIEAGVSSIYFMRREDYILLEHYNMRFSSKCSVEEMYPNRWFAYESAKKIFMHISKVINIKSAIDFGCGSGAWLKAVKDIYPDVRVLGLDNSEVERGEFLLENEFMPCDLTQYQITGGERYDIAISIEVAEHIDEKYADEFINRLCQASDVVLFSAAIRNQGGTHHVNEQYPSYWIKKFSDRGYQCIDCIRPKFWNDKSVILHCRQNCFLFVKKGREVEIETELNVGRGGLIDLVHPELFNAKILEVFER